MPARTRDWSASLLSLVGRKPPIVASRPAMGPGESGSRRSRGERAGAKVAEPHGDRVAVAHEHLVQSERSDGESEGQENRGDQEHGRHTLMLTILRIASEPRSCMRKPKPSTARPPGLSHIVWK